MRIATGRRTNSTTLCISFRRPCGSNRRGRSCSVRHADRPWQEAWSAMRTLRLPAGLKHDPKESHVASDESKGVPQKIHGTDGRPFAWRVFYSDAEDDGGGAGSAVGQDSRGAHRLRRDGAGRPGDILEECG